MQRFLIHPALTKTIEKKYNKTFMHFSGFILGKGLKEKSELLLNIMEARKILSEEKFISKYYFRP